MAMNELTFVSAEFEWDVERAEGDNGRQKKHRAEYNKHDPKQAIYHAAKIQIREQCGEYDTNDTIDIGHITFHD
jgi:hypothetical protein